MKLTIKDKQHLLSNLAEQQDKRTFAQQGFVKNATKGCCGGDYDKKQKILLTRNQSERNMQNLIKFDCQNLYSRICHRDQTIRETYKDLYQCIVDAIQTTKSRYNQCIGYLCAHATYHYCSEDERQYCVYSFVQAYRPIFDRPQLQQALVRETVRRFYMYLRQSEMDLDALPLQKIARRYQESMLLEFIPVEYSQFIIRQYLKMSDPEQYIELATSVVHFIVNTKSPLNITHCCEMMLNPFMGVVEWPIIIGHRKLFQPISDDAYEES